MFFPHTFRMLSQRITQSVSLPHSPSLSLCICLPALLAGNFHSFPTVFSILFMRRSGKKAFYSALKSQTNSSQTSAAKLCIKLAKKRPKKWPAHLSAYSAYVLNWA